jgi:hypothetical protein
MPKLELFGGTHLELRKNRWTAYLRPAAPSKFSPQSTVLDIDKIKQRQDLLEEAVMQVWLEAKKNRPPAGKTSIVPEAKVTEVKTKGITVNKALEKPDKPASSSMISGCRCFCNKELTEICNHIAVTPFLEPAGESRHEGKKDARLDKNIAFPSPPALPESERSSTEENQMEAETEKSIQDKAVVQGDREGVEAEPLGEASLHESIMFGPDGANSGKNLPDSKDGANNTTGVPPAKNDAKLQGNETVLETIPKDITNNQINETDLGTTSNGRSKQYSNQMLPDYGNSKENGSGNSDDSSSVGNIASDTTSAVGTDTGDTLVMDHTTDRKPFVDNDMSPEDTTSLPRADPSVSGKIQETGEVFLGSASIASSSSSNNSMANASAAVLLTELSDITASNGSDVSLSNITLVFPKITYRRIQAYESVRSGRSDWRLRFPDERRPFASFGKSSPTSSRRSRRSSVTPEGDSDWGRGGYRYGRSIINLIPMLTEEQERENAEERGFRDTLARVRQLGKAVFIVLFLFLFLFFATQNLKVSFMHICKT